MSNSNSVTSSCANALSELAVWVSDRLDASDERWFDSLKFEVNLAAKAEELYEDYICVDKLLREKLECLTGYGDRHRPSSGVRTVQCSALREAMREAMRNRAAELAASSELVTVAG